MNGAAQSRNALLAIKGKVYVDDDASRRKRSAASLPLLRDVLRVLVDLGLVIVTGAGG